MTTVGVPCHAERLQPTSGERQQNLLQGRGPEHVLHVVVGGSALGTGRADHEAVARTEERGLGLGTVSDLGVKVARDGRRVGKRHGVTVVGVAPRPVLSLVTGGARGGPDVLGVGTRKGRRRLATARQTCRQDRQQGERRVSCGRVQTAQCPNLRCPHPTGDKAG